MGRIQAREFADLVKEDVIDLDAALDWHLTSNHFPPVPSVNFPVIKQAVELARDDVWDRVLYLPNGREKTVAEIIDQLHLHEFVQDKEG